MNIAIPINDEYDNLDTLTITDDHMDNNNYVTIKLSTVTTEVTFAFDVSIDDLYFAIAAFREKALADNERVFKNHVYSS